MGDGRRETEKEAGGGRREAGGLVVMIVIMLQSTQCNAHLRTVTPSQALSTIALAPSPSNRITLHVKAARVFPSTRTAL